MFVLHYICTFEQLTPKVATAVDLESGSTAVIIQQKCIHQPVKKQTLKYWH